VKLTVERLPESRVSLDIAADETEFAQAVDRAARRVANDVVIPGFRKGKAPRSMIERLYGRDVFIEEANRTLMTDLYRQAMTQEDLVPVGEPEVEIITADPLAFKVVTAVYPTVEPGPYQDVRVEPLDATVTDAEIDEVLEDLRKNNSPWVDPESEGLEVGADMVLQPKQRLPRAGDQVTIDVHSETVGDPATATDETDAVFVLGESGLLDELEDAIKRLRVGESTTLEITFGEDEERANADVRGKTLAYAITLKGIKERDLLPLDDELAQTVSDFNTLDELRDSVRNNLHRDKTDRVAGEGYQQIVDKMLEGATIEVPAAMVDEAAHNELHALERRLAQQGMSLDAYLRLAEQTQEELEAELRPNVLKRLQTTLLLQEIAKRENVDVADEQVNNAAAIYATALLRASPEQAQAAMRDESFRSSIRDQLLDTMIRQRLIALATEERGIVANGWTPPQPPATEQQTDEADAASEAAGTGEPGDAIAVAPSESAVTMTEAGEAPELGEAPEATAAADNAPAEEAGPAAEDEALTIGTMPGQPGDLAEPNPAAGAADPTAGYSADEDAGGAIPHPTI
jgi:trigger factor